MNNLEPSDWYYKIRKSNFDVNEFCLLPSLNLRKE